MYLICQTTRCHDFYRTMRYSAKRGLAIVQLHSSVCLSVILVDQGPNYKNILQ